MVFVTFQYYPKNIHRIALRNSIPSNMKMTVFADIEIMIGLHVTIFTTQIFCAALFVSLYEFEHAYHLTDLGLKSWITCNQNVILLIVFRFSMPFSFFFPAVTVPIVHTNSVICSTILFNFPPVFPIVSRFGKSR